MPTAALPVIVSAPGLAVRTHCPFCAYQCGMLMAEEGELVDRVMGDPHFPVNNGQLCIKGWSSHELLRHPKRLTTPLVRDSVSEPFQETSWGDALDRVAAAFQRIRTEVGPNAVGVFGSGALTNEKAYLLGKFARVALQTANIDYNGRYCMSSAAAAQNRAFGIDRGLPFPLPDLEKAEVIWLSGANPLDTLPPLLQWLERQKAGGGRLIVTDPRRTPTARAADLFLQITPGSDLALANGMLAVAIEEGLIDKAYIEARTTGFDAVRRAVLAYHPARVERLTGISASQYRTAVRWLASAQSTMILSARGVEQQSKGVDTVHSLINLALALGKVGRPNSGYGCLTGQGNGQGGREHGQKADQLPGYRLIENEEHRAAVARAWNIDPATLPRKGKSAFELIDAIGKPGGIRGLLVMGSNVALASPDQERTKSRLGALDFLAVCDAFENETTAQAHVVLPVLQWAEEEGTMTNLEGRVIHRRPTVRAPGGVRSDINILCQLADRLGAGKSFDFANSREVFEEFRRATAGGVADYSGITYEMIDAEDGVFWPCPAPSRDAGEDLSEGRGTPRLFAERFHHPDGRARFFAVDHRSAGEEPDHDYPIYFTTGRYREHYNSGAQTRLMNPLVAAHPRPRLQIHPRLAGRHQIAKGSTVLLESRRGSAEFAVELTSDIRPDTAFAPFHWGGRQAANALTNPALDPVSRMPEFKFCAVRIAAVWVEATESPRGRSEENRGVL